jgi:predicted small lipoprotein YifL
MRVALILTGLLPLTACGQTGALYLPDEGVQTPVEIRAPGSPAPSPAPQTESDDEEKKSDQPPGR